MHATIRHAGPADAVQGIRGTFYADAGSRPERSIGSGLAKIAVLLVAVAVVRGVIGRAGGHRGVSGMTRRRQMIAELHRELHAEDAAAPDAPAK
jgi:hypothetical protein